MNRLTMIKLAFADWFKNSSAETLKQICNRLEKKHARGFDYTTINSYFPLKPATILLYETEDASLNPEQRRLTIEKMSEIVRECGFDLVFADKGDPESCLNGKSYLNVRRLARESNSSDKYYMYYLNSDNKFSRKEMIMDFGTGNVQVADDESDSGMLKGTITTVNISVFIITIYTSDDHPFWYITYNKSKQGKDFRLCLYLKISGKKSQPAVGEAVIVRAEHIISQPKPMEDFASYLLYKKRRQIPESKFFSKQILEDDVLLSNFPHVNNWHSLQRFKGTWLGFFINPIEKRFEKCHIRIGSNGHFKMWVNSDKKNPYSGICKKINDLVVLKYDHRAEMDDYRSSIVLEAGNYDGSLYSSEDGYSTLYGILGCIERSRAKPASTRIALRKMEQEPTDMHPDFDLHPLPIERVQDVDNLKIILDDDYFFDFFRGIEKPEFLSTDWIRKVQGE